eukprot:gene11862-5191_t
MEKTVKIEEIYQNLKKKNFADIPDLSVKEYLELKKSKKTVLIDHREEEEQKVSIIPGAIPSTNFKLEKIKEEYVIVYCTIGFRSGKFVKELLEKYSNLKGKIFNLKGSILSWTYEGDKALVNPQGNETKKVHVFGPSWDYSNSTYEPVYFSNLYQGYVGLKNLMK